MDFRHYWEHTRARLDEELDGWVRRFFRDLPARQVATVRHILADGKRLRGCLTCLVNGALGGRLEDALPRAVAIECIQAASLIHDDYIDGDTVRRNRAAHWTIDGPRKAVLLGDVVFATVIQRMAEISREDGMTVAAAIATMAQGAYQEYLEPVDLTTALAAGRRRRDHYDRIVYLKTGALFGAAAKLGAISAGAARQLCDVAFRYGVRVGEAYQIADDLCDLVAPPDRSVNGHNRIAELAPLLFRFAAEAAPYGTESPDRRPELFIAWLDSARSSIKKRMHDAIRIRGRLAAGEAARFPENDHAALLCAVPAEIVRLLEPAAPSRR